MTDIPAHLPPVQLEVLRLLKVAPAGSTIEELAMLDRLSPRSLRVALRSLHRKGLVERDGRRGARWTITAAGEGWVPQVNSTYPHVHQFARLLRECGTSARQVSLRVSHTSANLVLAWIRQGVEPGIGNFEAALNELGHTLKIVPLEEEETR